MRLLYLATSLLGGVAFCSARQLPPREVRTLSTHDLDSIAKLDPPEWSSVSEGHLSKLLIPRVCESALPFTSTQLMAAGSKNK
jgi:hypothetical protein